MSSRLPRVFNKSATRKSRSVGRFLKILFKLEFVGILLDIDLPAFLAPHNVLLAGSTYNNDQKYFRDMHMYSLVLTWIQRFKVQRFSKIFVFDFSPPKSGEPYPLD